MATSYNPILDEQKDEQSQVNEPEDQGQEPSTGSSSAPSMAGSTGSGNVGAAPASKAASGASRSGNFTNIQNYIQANRQGAQKLGQDVANKVGSKVQSGLGEVQQNRQASLDQAKGLADQYTATQGAGQQAIQSIAQGGQNLDLGALESKAQGALSDQYKTDLQNSQFQNLANLQNKSNELNELGKQTLTSSGRKAILERNFARPDYTAGQSSFDTLLLGGSKEAQQGLSKARQNVGQFNPNLQKATSEFDASKQQTAQNLDQGLSGIQNLLKQATSRDAVANPDQSLYAKLAKEAADYNAQQSKETAGISNKDALAALNNAGYKVKSLDDMVTIPGTNVSVSARMLARNSDFFKEQFQNADLQNINTEALSRLNVLNRLAKLDELAPTQTLNREINRNLSDQGQTAITNAQNALKAQGLANLDEFNVARNTLTPEALKQISEGGLGFAGVRGWGVNLISDLQKLPNDQLAKFLTKSGFGADAKSAPLILQDIIKDANAYMWAQQPENQFSSKNEYAGGSMQRLTGNPYNFSMANPYYRQGQSWGSYENAINFAKKVAEEQIKYNQQQQAISNIINKYIKGEK